MRNRARDGAAGASGAERRVGSGGAGQGRSGSDGVRGGGRHEDLGFEAP